MNYRRSLSVMTITVATSLVATTASNAAAGPDIQDAVALIQSTSQDRADLIGADAPAASAMRINTADFGRTEARQEAAARQELVEDDPLMAGTERLNVGPGEISVELIDSKRTDTGNQLITVQETAKYPYVDDAEGEYMGESYQRQVELAPSGSEWTIVDNQVPEGSWPLIEGAVMTEDDFEPSMSNDTVNPTGEEPMDTAEASNGTIEEETAAAAKRTRADAYNYALNYALSPSKYYRHFDNDCTNFVSQSLRVGGFVRRNLMENPTSYWVWWYDHEKIDEWSHSWAVAHYNYRFHTTTGRGDVVSSTGQLWRGDLLYADWQNDGKMDHVMMVTGSDPDTGLRVSGHSNNRRNVDMSWWQTKGRSTKPAAKYTMMHMNWGKF